MVSIISFIEISASVCYFSLFPIGTLIRKGGYLYEKINCSNCTHHACRFKYLNARTSRELQGRQGQARPCKDRQNCHKNNGI